MAPPAKRRKRNIIESSPQTSDNDDEESIHPKNSKIRLSNLMPSSLPSSNGLASISDSKAKTAFRSSNPPSTRAKTANHPHNAAPICLPNNRKTSTKSPSTSPEKKRRTGKVEEKRKNADINTFFTRQAQRQQAEGSAESIPKPRLRVLSTREIQQIEDLISDDDEVGENKAQTVSMVGQAAKRSVGMGRSAFTMTSTNAPSSSQKFVKPSQVPAEARSEDDTRPWAERFGPTTLEELGVHKKKVADVRTWLDDVMEGRMRQRLLILKGAAGTGKTTTVQLLAKDMRCDVLEWRNPIGSVASSDGFQSMAAQFEEFMGRGGKFGQLDLFSANSIAYARPEPEPLDRRKQIILIEEFPNTFTRSSSALQSFRSTILQYLASNTPPLSMANNKIEKEPVTPLVMIISETLLTTTSASADSFTAHRLLGPEILQHPGVNVIEFNAIAPTILAKALETIVQKESRKSGRRKTPGPQVLKKLGEIGDIRSAIGSLEFMCLRGDVDDWGGKIAFGKAKKTSKDTSLTRMEEESLELITRREASLGIFHAVGKVVYNKRDGQVPGDVERLPHFISHHARPKKSEVHIDELIDETGTDTQTFIAALHENYILSCDAPASSYEFSSLDHVNGCIDALSESDLLCPSWDGSFQSSGLGGGFGGSGSGGDVLRQDEITFQIAVRGILHSLPHPVTRKATSASGFRTGKAGDQHKMFYPTSLRLWRMKEEIESTIDLWTTKLRNGEFASMGSVTAGANAYARPKAGTVESWKAKNTSTSSGGKGQSKGKEEADSAPLLSLGASARTEMLLERLPYMVQIAKAKARSSVANSAFAVRDMEKVTAFRGIGNVGDEGTDDKDDDDVGGDWATDKPGEGTSPRKKLNAVVMRKGRGEKAGGMLKKQEVVKYVLSDDDIED